MEVRTISALLCTALLPSFVLAIDKILGDKVKFQQTENCKKSGATLVQLLKHDSGPLVARWDVVWRPEPAYENRMSPNDSVSFNQTCRNDNGLYVLTCGPDSENQTFLNVVFPFLEAVVSEGDPGRLTFHHFTAGKRGKFRMERNGELVLELDLSSGEMRYGTGFEGRLSLSQSWKMSGEFTVTLQGVKPEDQGDFFSYIQDEDPTLERKGLSAVRLKIREKIPDQTTCPPPTAAAGICLTKKEMITWIVVCIVCILAVVLMALAFCCGRFWKPNVPSGPGGGTGPAPTDGTDVEMQPLAEPRPPGSHVNGGLRPIANGQ